MVKAEAGHPEAEETARLLNDLILRSQELLREHPLNLRRQAEGKDPANSIWPWSPGYRPQMEPFGSRFPQVRSGAVITAVDLIRGIGHYAGLRRIDVPGATGLYDTNYEGKVRAALDALRTDDFVYLHVEASDEAGHEGDLSLKQRTIEDLDSRQAGCLFRFRMSRLGLDHQGAERLQGYVVRGRAVLRRGVCLPRRVRPAEGRPIHPSIHERLTIPMNYYSTNHQSPLATLQEAVTRGLAPDKGLYMPEAIRPLPRDFYEHIDRLSLQEIACRVADAFFGDDVPQETLHDLVTDTLSFDIPLVPVGRDIYSLELFHGPTLAFKDVGARFMARLLGYFIRREGEGEVNVLVATSGDTGSAVANGFLGVPGIRVYVLYPKGKVSEIQEKQFTTLGRNITAIEVDGTFDDCQALVKDAFMDADLNAHMRLTSANSINVARFLPQSFYYFHAYAQLKREGRAEQMVVCVPSGNFGNITAGLFAARMGLPVGRFIAANNRNDVFYQYLRTGVYTPRPSIATIANAMDVGAPSNFARILALYGESHEAICADISGTTYTDEQIAETIRRTWADEHYLLDPHGACGCRALQEGLRPGETGVFLETAHPAKFKDTVEGIIGQPVAIPDKLQAFLRGTKQSVPMPKDFPAFKDYLMGQ